MRLSVKAVPGASRDEIVGWLGSALKVRISVPAERGRANAAIVQLIAKRLGIPKQAVHITTGMASSRKILEIVGLSETEVHDRLARFVTE